MALKRTERRIVFLVWKQARRASSAIRMAYELTMLAGKVVIEPNSSSKGRKCPMGVNGNHSSSIDDRG